MRPRKTVDTTIYLHLTECCFVLETITTNSGDKLASLLANQETNTGADITSSCSS